MCIFGQMQTRLPLTLGVARRDAACMHRGASCQFSCRWPLTWINMQGQVAWYCRSSGLLRPAPSCGHALPPLCLRDIWRSAPASSCTPHPRPYLARAPVGCCPLHVVLVLSPLQGVVLMKRSRWTMHTREWGPQKVQQELKMAIPIQGRVSEGADLGVC